MSEFFSQTLTGFTAMSHWEYIAVFFSVVYLLFAIKENSWCWPAAFASTLIYTLLYWNGALLMESLLNVYYMVMAIVGWYWWKNPKQQAPLEIQSWSLEKHTVVIVCTGVATLVFGYFMDNYTRAEMAYLDSFTTCFAIVTTYLVAQKVLENWLYWVVIDAASMYLYYAKGYYPTLALFVFYTLMAMWGFKTWYEELEQRTGKKLVEL
ncbi:nicotinamide riboside transporter PnuC [Pseudoalteromonas xiamenensis]|uniref:nicotinamide riboside transporter PnuC n=1 Tax=Pseudoalteromonas xiamenensis TaxID=882626 RepID=UPI0027E50BD8|nr:nicotinamide riboside transporter PnuC [Pseudoalteromonas xiamenensis]WMN58321.1 nicotinamide riboside transporter PnuC [Pseudoalteromonas xiamenensis]